MLVRGKLDSRSGRLVACAFALALALGLAAALPSAFAHAQGAWAAQPAWAAEAQPATQAVGLSTAATKASASLSDGWHTIKGKRYRYQDGKPLTGPQIIEGKGYYFDKKGVMQTGLKKVDGYKCYFKKNGGGRDARLPCHAWRHAGFPACDCERLGHKTNQRKHHAETPKGSKTGPHGHQGSLRGAHES